MSFDLDALRQQFPAIMATDIAYLDNAATSQKPKVVLEAMANYYQTSNANVHRGAHQLSVQATRLFEDARGILAEFIQAPHRQEIIFTRGTTEAMNLLANSLGSLLLQPGDTILIDIWAHHASIVPWQQVAQRYGAQLIPIPLNAAGRLDDAFYQAQLKLKPKLVILTQVSNALGTQLPVKEWVTKAKQVNAITIIDGAQAVPHIEVNVQDIGCDFYAFSGHKMFGPTGIGVLWGKQALLEAMPPWQFGGEMIKHVSFNSSSFNQLPFKFEAGTPAIAEAIGLAAAAHWLSQLDRNAIAQHESKLLALARTRLATMDQISLHSAFENNLGSLAFNLIGEHHQDVGIWLDGANVAIRSGHHCCQPLMQALNLKGTCRLSVAPYNTSHEIERALDAIFELQEFLADEST